MRTKLSLTAALLPLLVARIGFAQGPVIAFDEFGNGAFGHGFFAPDPGPGGLNPVMTYNLPFPGVQGDVALREGGVSGPVFDYIRFNGNGTLLFYSDNVDGFDAPADTPGPPGQPVSLARSCARQPAVRRPAPRSRAPRRRRRSSGIPHRRPGRGTGRRRRRSGPSSTAAGGCSGAPA